MAWIEVNFAAIMLVVFAAAIAAFAVAMLIAAFQRVRRRKFAAGLLLLSSLVIATGLGLWTFWWEPSSLIVRERQLALPGWPRELEGLRVVVLADFHVGSPMNGLERLQRIVEAANAAAPDVILLAGDFVISDVVGGSWTEPARFAPLLGRLKAPLGVYAVLGNHDWWEGPQAVRAALTGAGIKVLDNQVVEIDAGAARFLLAGIGDFTTKHHDPGILLNAGQGPPMIALTHNPDVFPLIGQRPALTIAGHTHGGQVNFPILGRLIVPSIYGSRFAIGHIVEDNRHLFVSPGLGTSILAVRFRVPPEISVLVLMGSQGLPEPSRE